MVYARQGLRFADKLLVILALSWFLIFIALRFVVGRGRDPDEKLAKKGLRLITNYVIKNLYQQMLFFLVPLYASSATWSLSSPNWWLPVLLLVFAVLSTMDLVFDNVVMEHRLLASAMYGVCMFGVLNLILPMVFAWPHFRALLVAAVLTAPAVALLSFRVGAIIRPLGLIVTVGAAAGMVAAVWVGRRAIPPAPTAMSAGAFGHGKPGEFECLPGRKHRIPSNQLHEFRCVTEVAAPGGLHDMVIHRWRHQGKTVYESVAARIPSCEGQVLISRLSPAPVDSTGRWQCIAETADGQLLGAVSVKVIEAEGNSTTRDGATRDAGAHDAGAHDAGARDAGARDAGARDADISVDAAKDASNP